MSPGQTILGVFSWLLHEETQLRPVRPRAKRGIATPSSLPTTRRAQMRHAIRMATTPVRFSPSVTYSVCGVRRGSKTSRTCCADPTGPPTLWIRVLAISQLGGCRRIRPAYSPHQARIPAECGMPIPTQASRPGNFHNNYTGAFIHSSLRTPRLLRITPVEKCHPPGQFAGGARFHPAPAGSCRGAGDLFL